jgi:hypothetical protein
MSPLIDPVVNLHFHQISSRGKELSPSADEFSTFLREHFLRWATNSDAADSMVVQIHFMATSSPAGMPRTLGDAGIIFWIGLKKCSADTSTSCKSVVERPRTRDEQL